MAIAIKRTVSVTALVILILVVSVVAQLLYGRHTTAEHAIDSSTTRLAAQIGISPESLTLAGLSGADASVILAQLETASTLQSLLETARSDASRAADAAGDALDTLRSDPANALVRTQYDEAVAAFEAADARVQSLKTDLYDAAMDGCSSQAIGDVAHCALQLGRRMPPEFAVIDDTRQDWRALERASIAERRAARRTDEDLDAVHAAVLSNARARTDVAAAEQRLLLNLGAVQAAFAPDP